MNKEINYSINFLKFISIFAVINLHCIAVNNMAGKFNILYGLLKFGVPIFFLISGFYSYYENDSKAKQKYKKRSVRLLKLIIIANLFYFITTPKFYNIQNWINFFNIKSIGACLIFNLPLIAGHLWFLDALLYCYIFILILYKFKFKIKYLYLFIPILLLINIIFGEISSIIQLPIPVYIYRNFMFTGLPFFMLGYLIHDKKNIISNKISNNFIIISLLPILCLTIFESIYSTADLYLGTILFSTIIFIWAVLNPNKINFKIFNLIGGKLYAYIYILHIFVIMTLLKDISINVGYLNSFLVFIVTIIISYFMYFLINKY